MRLKLVPAYYTAAISIVAMAMLPETRNFDVTKQRAYSHRARIRRVVATQVARVLERL
ncbi:hypothetical protein Q3C01_44160 [Bradyrhizobium sp. UFLA05-109]